MWGQINVLTLLKNVEKMEKRVGSSTLHRRMPKAHFAKHSHTIVNTKTRIKIC